MDLNTSPQIIMPALFHSRLVVQYIAADYRPSGYSSETWHFFYCVQTANEIAAAPPVFLSHHHCSSRPALSSQISAAARPSLQATLLPLARP